MDAETELDFEELEFDKPGESNSEAYPSQEATGNHPVAFLLERLGNRKLDLNLKLLPHTSKGKAEGSELPESRQLEAWLGVRLGETTPSFKTVAVGGLEELLTNLSDFVIQYLEGVAAEPETKAISGSEIVSTKPAKSPNNKVSPKSQGQTVVETSPTPSVSTAPIGVQPSPKEKDEQLSFF